MRMLLPRVTFSVRLTFSFRCLQTNPSSPTTMFVKGGLMNIIRVAHQDFTASDEQVVERYKKYFKMNEKAAAKELVFVAANIKADDGADEEAEEAAEAAAAEAIKVVTTYVDSLKEDLPDIVKAAAEEDATAGAGKAVNEVAKDIKSEINSFTNAVGKVLTAQERQRQLERQEEELKRQRSLMREYTRILGDLSESPEHMRTVTVDGHECYILPIVINGRETCIIAPKAFFQVCCDHMEPPRGESGGRSEDSPNVASIRSALLGIKDGPAAATMGPLAIMPDVGVDEREVEEGI